MFLQYRINSFFPLAVYRKYTCKGAVSFRNAFLLLCICCQFILFIFFPMSSFAYSQDNHRYLPVS